MCCDIFTHQKRAQGGGEVKFDSRQLKAVMNLGQASYINTYTHTQTFHFPHTSECVECF